MVLKGRREAVSQVLPAVTHDFLFHFPEIVHRDWLMGFYHLSFFSFGRLTPDGKVSPQAGLDNQIPVLLSFLDPPHTNKDRKRKDMADPQRKEEENRHAIPGVMSGRRLSFSL